MPKIKDLGINAIPETMRPPEIGAGGGGGCGGGTPNCPTGTTPMNMCPTGTTGMHTMNWNVLPCPTGTTGFWACPTGTTPQCPAGTVNCPTGTITPQLLAWTPIILTTCPAGTFVGPCSDVAQTTTGGLSRESIEQLRNQLRQQMAQLDELAKAVGPKTIQEIDQREQQLRAELEELARRRDELNK